MSHLFEVFQSTAELTAFQGPGIVVKNVSNGPVEVDEDGRRLYPNCYAAIDDSCAICNGLISEGKLEIFNKFSAPQASKSKAKSADAASSDNKQTVASAEDTSSVQ